MRRNFFPAESNIHITIVSIVKTRYRSIFGVPIGVTRFVKLLENAPLFRVIFWRISRIFVLKKRRFRSMRRQFLYQIPRNISEVLAVEESQPLPRKMSTKTPFFRGNIQLSTGFQGHFRTIMQCFILPLLS